MIPALLLGSALALGPTSSKLVGIREPTQFDQITHPELEFVAQATQTHFTALNPTAHPTLLVFSHRGGGIRASVLLAPGDQLASRFPHGTLEGLWLEVVSLDPQRWSTTGALAIDDMTAEGVRALWVEREVGVPTGRLSAWILDGVGLAPIFPEGDYAPIASKASPTHVPGAVPRKTQRREKAPRIKRDPLPPL